MNRDLINQKMRELQEVDCAIMRKKTFTEEDYRKSEDATWAVCEAMGHSRKHATQRVLPMIFKRIFSR